jgi:hypothetical protein
MNRFHLSTAAGILAAALALPASAHKASDAYLQLESRDAGTTLRLDVALRDLDAALDLDADGDGRLTWGEVRRAWPAIESYALARVQVGGCALRPVRTALEARSDGAYAALFFESTCALRDEPAIRYTLMREVDATHRGIAKITLGGQSPVVRVLDPAHAATLPAVPADEVVVAAPTPSATPLPDVAVATSPSVVTAAAAPPAATPEVGSFLRDGVQHILGGYDHVLFLLCLLLPSVMRRTSAGWQAVPRLRDALLPVFGVVTAFTLAHSITLALASLRIVSLSPRFIEPAIAVTIVLAALDNLWPIFRGRRGIVTFLFGLVHGFGFAGVLAELNLPSAQFAWALLQFNLGLELGQLMIVVLAMGLLYLGRRHRGYPAWVIRGGSIAAMAVAALWFIERTADVALLPL